MKRIRIPKLSDGNLSLGEMSPHHIQKAGKNIHQCSKTCACLLIRASSYSFGMCHAVYKKVSKRPERTGFVISFQIGFITGLSTIAFHSHGGTPSINNGGKAYIKSMCWTICMLNKKSSPIWSIGEPTVTYANIKPE